MDFTTVARVKSWSPVSSSSTQFDGMIAGQISAVSRKIESYLNRPVTLQLRTEEYDVEPLAHRFQLRAAPVYNTVAHAQNPNFASTVIVAAAPVLTYSVDRTFTEDAEDASIYHVMQDSGRVEFDFPINYNGIKWSGALRVAYYAGLAYSLDQLVASSTSHSGSPLTVGTAVTGSLSGATGTVLAITSDVSITVKVLSGSFEVGESFVSDAIPSNYAAFTAWGATGAPLCMAYPELVEATNMQVSWWFQNRERQGYNTMSVEGATISMEKSGTLLKGVKETIDHLVRYGVSY